MRNGNATVITTHAAATRVFHPRALPAAPGMHASGRHPNASRGPWHPHCTCRKASCMQAHAACASDGQRPVGRCSICGIYSISGGVIYLDCYISGCSIPGCSISGQKWAEGHDNVIAPNHWHRWHVKSQYGTCHIFWPQEHWRLNISLIYCTGLFREMFCREDHPKYSLEYSTDWIAVLMQDAATNAKTSRLGHLADGY